jgi:hypothetical protein
MNEQRAKDILEVALACQRHGWNPKSTLWCTSTHSITLQHLLDVAELIKENKRYKESLSFTLRQLQKAVNGNSLDDEMVMAELQARKILQE